ncbi:MAG: phosphatidylserine decarboxylase [Deltaproteobacteria bacterium]|nr:phosphatidylserine decarboxylase [Deltaproteobacteria bacterium]
MRLALKLIGVLPLRKMSYILGLFAGIRLPKPILSFIIRRYCRFYHVNMGESLFPIEAFATMQDFFTRELKGGCRPIRDGLISPVDGRIEQMGYIKDGTLLQVKGKAYQLCDLIPDNYIASSFANSWYCSIYLAPGDYHHIHSPVSGRIKTTYLIPGTLWPVNSWSVRHVDRVFCRNERIVTIIKNQSSEVCLVCVGATNVGSILLHYDDIVANRSFFLPTKETKKDYEKEISVDKGSKVASFRLGSTVIMLIKDDKFSPISSLKGTVKMGETLGYG